MAGSLIKITETTVSSVASVTLGGSDWDNSYDVYMVRLNNVIPASDVQKLSVRFTVSGTADSSANYDRAQKVLRTTAAFGNQTVVNASSVNSLDQGGTGTQESLQGIHYLYNFNNANEYSFISYEGTARSSVAELNARQGGGVLTVAQACDGVQYYFASGNIASGTFALYGLKK